MATMVEVEHWSADGSVSSRRMRLREWRKLFDGLGEIAVGEFYLAYGDLKRRWDGCQLMTLKGFACRCGYRVKLEDRKGRPVPVVYPCRK